jgi:hypothetical protein
MQIRAFHLPVLLAACAAPGVKLIPLDSDFALLEVDLRG